MEDKRGYFAALDVSQEQTAICIVDAPGVVLAEGKVSTCPDAILAWLERQKLTLEKLGMETGPLAVCSGTSSRPEGCPSSASTPEPSSAGRRRTVTS
jgi:hypothetical protein